MQPEESLQYALKEKNNRKGCFIELKDPESKRKKLRTKVKLRLEKCR